MLHHVRARITPSPAAIQGHLRACPTPVKILGSLPVCQLNIRTDLTMSPSLTRPGTLGSPFIPRNLILTLFPDLIWHSSPAPALWNLGQLLAKYSFASTSLLNVPFISLTETWLCTLGTLLPSGAPCSGGWISPRGLEVGWPHLPPPCFF